MKALAICDCCTTAPAILMQSNIQLREGSSTPGSSPPRRHCSKRRSVLCLDHQLFRRYHPWVRLENHHSSCNDGWENTFATDFNSDGLISGGRSYQLASLLAPYSPTAMVVPTPIHLHPAGMPSKLSPQTPAPASRSF